MLLGAVLLCTGCATLPTSPSPGDSASHGLRAAHALRQRAGEAPQAPAAAESASERNEVRLYRRHSERRLLTDATLVSPEEMAWRQAAGAQPTPQEPPSCGGHAVPESWPDYSSWLDEELLAPFFQCASPAEFLALQRQVDMPRLVEKLGDWSAVRLSALGPMEAPAAQVLQRKRFSFLVNAHRLYGAYAQVLTLFLFDTAFDDEVRELLVLLARDKQLAQTVGQMEVVREALVRRGFPLSDYPERQEQASDVVRGLGRALDDVASTMQVVDGMRGSGVYGTRAHLPPPYQEVFDETERALTEARMAPGNQAWGYFDHLTFGVPLGFYHLAVGTGHGVYMLTQGQYEQATRELAPAALLVSLYAGGKGVRYLSEPSKLAGAGQRGGPLQVLELRLKALGEVAERLRARLGEEGLGQLARYIRAQREAAVMVGAGGEPAAMALYEARGNVPKARHSMLAVANSQGTRPISTKAGAGTTGGTEGSPGRGPSTEAPIRNTPQEGTQRPTTDASFEAAGSPGALVEAGEVASSVRWKGFSDGKLASHFKKHVLVRGEFGGEMTKNQYLKMAKEFAQEKNKRFLERVVGNFVVKYDPVTRRTLIGHLKDREIRTFYEADLRVLDPFAAAVEMAESLGGRP